MLNQLLQTFAGTRGSDLHLLAGQPVRMRHHGTIQIVDPTPVDGEALAAALTQIMPAGAVERFKNQNQVDFAYEIPQLARFRVNAFAQLGGLGAVFRAIPTEIPSLRELGLPPVLGDLCRQRNGLILVTGRTGAGKSTTLAAMIDLINQTRDGHILTIEDPIEFLHPKRACLLSQREIGTHTPDFATALRSVLREDPDVLLIGELRDAESIALAVTAAETGILVLSTLHTDSAEGSIDRIVDTFPTAKQGHVRSMLATSLRAVISQRLVPRDDSDGRVAALEILINTSAVANLVRRNNHAGLRDAMASGAEFGMQTLEQAVRDLVRRGTVAAAVADAVSADRCAA